MSVLKTSKSNTLLEVHLNLKQHIMIYSGMLFPQGAETKTCITRNECSKNDELHYTYTDSSIGIGEWDYKTEGHPNKNM